MQKWAVGSGPTLGFVAASLVILGSAAIATLNIRTVADNDLKVVQTHEVLQALDAVLVSLTEAEAAQRSYLLTGVAAYSQEFEQHSAEVGGQINRIVQATTDNPDQVAIHEDLRKTANDRLTTLREGNEIRDSQGFDTAREFVALGIGKRQMDAVKDVLQTMRDKELVLLSTRENQSRRSHWTAIVSSLLAALVGLAMVATAYIFTAREIQSRAEAQTELEARVLERTRDLNTANSALRTSNRDLEQFASVASHDLQEPLRKIEAFGDRLQTRSREALDEQGRDYLERILHSASRMRTLINDLLNYSRVSTRVLPFTRIDLAKIAGEVVTDLDEQLHQSRGTVNIGELPDIDADQTQMRQLFQNLIGNALKFQRPDVAPVVNITSEFLTASQGEPQCRISISDNGIGFEETYLDRIFQLFQRLHGRNEYEGTGIGLAICRKVVERHRGTITARSRPGEGSTFIMTLPMRQPDKETG